MEVDDTNRYLQKIRLMLRHVCSIIQNRSRKWDVWENGRTCRYRYECMGATTLILEHVVRNTQPRILDAGCSHGTAIVDCKSFLEDSGHDSSVIVIDRDPGRITRSKKKHAKNQTRRGFVVMTCGPCHPLDWHKSVLEPCARAAADSRSTSEVFHQFYWPHLARINQVRYCTDKTVCRFEAFLRRHADAGHASGSRPFGFPILSVDGNV